MIHESTNTQNRHRLDILVSHLYGVPDILLIRHGWMSGKIGENPTLPSQL